MDSSTIIIAIVSIIGTIATILAVKSFTAKNQQNPQLEKQLDALSQSMNRFENLLREEFRINRQETAELNQKNRTELADSLQKALEQFRTSFEKSVADFNQLQKDKFFQMEEKQVKLLESTEKRLDQMRETVDEKLSKTLSERLGQSFETVGKQLEAVQLGLGEMKTLAQDVGGLKKVLSNVKQRGGVGEVQLEMLLEQILAPDQYQANVATKSGSRDIVEFAIKLPGKDANNQEPVYLPIDAKFPLDAYEHLSTAYELADPKQIEAASKNFDAAVKNMAKDIRDKYLDPPNTTDFGIMFLPFESVYAEVVRKASLLQDLQRNYKVIVTGPTTLAAILNSLQMGFRTLALQKRSSEVWQVLGAVKTEFEKFGGLLSKAQGNIQTGLNQLETVVGTRTRAIQRTLKSVESLSDADANLLFNNPANSIANEEDDEPTSNLID